MSEHKATITWARHGVDFGYQTYPRDHVWRFENGIEVPASAAPAYLGNPQRVDPEAAFVAALSSCHMLTCLALASNQGFVVDRYDDTAVGHLEKNANGTLAVTRVELHPKIVYGGARQPTQADLDWLHDKAHRGLSQPVQPCRRNRGLVSACGRGGSPVLTDDAFLVPHMTGCPLLIEFAPGSTLYRQLDIVSSLPIYRNGPPGTFVDLLNGLRISLPTDQTVFVDDEHGRVTVGFGGMRFAGLKDERLIFLRVRELFSEEQLSPARSHVMILEPQWVASLLVRGGPVWPERGP